MPILHDLKAIFIHIPKTGGTSIEETLIEEAGSRDWKIKDNKNWYGNIESPSNLYSTKYCYELDHSTLRYMKNNCQFYEQSYFKFAFVRNPYARLVSEYNHCKYGYSRFIKKKEFDSFEDFVLVLKERFQFILENEQKNHWLISHYLPQYKFTHNYIDKPLTDFIGKLENIEEDWKYITEILKLEKELLKSEKYSSGFSYDYESYYTPQLKEIVYELYEKDFIYFDYEK